MLYDKSVRRAITRLMIADLQQQLPGEAESDQVVLPIEDLCALMTTASALALSDEQRDRSIAYEVCTRILELVGSSVPGFVVAADLILARLGNFPGRTLLNSRYRADASLQQDSPVLLSLEALSRELENTVDVFEEEPITLTDFQYDLLEGMRNHEALSVSAPTSAGKSFVLSLAIIERLRRMEGAVIYVVPTRALIRQVLVKIVRDLKRASMEDVPVRCIPIPVAVQDESSTRAVYVLTQERMLSLLNSDHRAPKISTVIIDEAQGIGDGARGIILHSAVDLVLARNPSADIYFASPLSSNPGYLLQLFRRKGGTAAWTESVSPVSQNCILVHTVLHDTHRARFQLVGRNRRFDLGERSFSFPLRGPLPVRRARFALAITQFDDSTLIYASEPSEAEAIAAALCRELPTKDNLHPDISDFISFLREYVHPQYPLIACLQSGVAFHYGQMPAGVRTRVEDLAERGILRFICCTSTLLQGVNLPARHIVVENPRRGVGQRMQRGDFLNLAGRAGRLLQEFHGNVWCLEPSHWPENCYEGEKLTPIKSAFSEAMADGGSLIDQALIDRARAKDRELARAALGKVFTDFILPNQSLSGSTFAHQGTIEALKLVEQKCSQIPLTLPRNIVRKNFTIPPQRLQALYDELKNQPNLIDCAPIQPFMPGVNRRLKWIMEKVQIHLEGIENGSYMIHAVVASAWMHNQPLHSIIANWLTFYGTKAEKVGTEIRKILEMIETDIRYRYVRNLKAYSDVLSALLLESGYVRESETIVPLHLYLECGASNPTVINLISLGLSRTTALLVPRRVHFPETATPEQCLAILSKINVERLRIPEVCRSELREILGR